jgi:hypothetical protein
MRRFAAIALACAAVGGCATPVSQSDAPKTDVDKNTSYSVEDRPDGFLISVAYSRYQFIPESGAVAEACKQALTAQAFDVADRRGRKIERVNEQRIKISMGRNGLSGITSCEASVPVRWAQ